MLQNCFTAEIYEAKYSSNISFDLYSGAIGNDIYIVELSCGNLVDTSRIIFNALIFEDFFFETENNFAILYD